MSVHHKHTHYLRPVTWKPQKGQQDLTGMDSTLQARLVRGTHYSQHTPGYENKDTMSDYRECELGKRLHLGGPRPAALVLSWKLVMAGKGLFPAFCASHPCLHQSTYLGRSPGISHIDLGLVVTLRQDGYISPSTHT